MWKVLIADDEPKIRQGLRNTIDTFGLPVEVCAEAKNGQDALEKAMEFKPDILLVDICMPRLGGIQFLEELKKTDKDSKVIIISGFNEFSYAKQAISLGVHSYLLKPIAENELKDILIEVVTELEQRQKTNRFMEMMQQQFIQNKQQLREAFFNDWINGELSVQEWQEQKDLLEIELPDSLLFIVISIQYGFVEEFSDGSVAEEVYRITMKKIADDLLGEYQPVHIFISRYQDVVCLVGGYEGELEKFYQMVTEKINTIVERRCCIQIRICQKEEIPELYEAFRIHARKVLSCRPIVLEARTYIYEHYQQRELDLTQVADAIGCNSSYLSRLMKQELGMSFKDFLTMCRISKAITLMRNEDLSLNQIAEQVGYNNQHYFSAAFKNCQGISPSEFRRSLN